MRRITVAVAVLCMAVSACEPPEPPETREAPTTTDGEPPRVSLARSPRDFAVAHVIVALCDNTHQGIVKVSAALGNGQDPRQNLYWGAMYGVKTFFNRSPHWRAVPIAGDEPTAPVLERCVYRAEVGGRVVYVVAEAYDGAHMRRAVADFFESAAGRRRVDVQAGGALIESAGRADVVCFVGHNGLMDFRLSHTPQPAAGDRPAHAMVFACRSEAYFAEPLVAAGCEPIVTTHGLMAPEAYVLDAALRAWAGGASTRQAASAAYAKYQRCSPRAADRLFGVAR